MHKALSLIVIVLLLAGCYNTEHTTPSNSGVRHRVVERCLNGFKMLEYGGGYGSLTYMIDEDGKPIPCEVDNSRNSN